MRVLHIGNEKSWRGGENQIRLLIEGLKPLGIESIVAYPAGSRGLERFRQICETIELPSRSAYDPRSILRLIKYCRANHIDLIDAHSSGGMSLALSIKKRVPNLKLVVHRRVATPIKKNWISKRKYLNPLVDRYVCISAAIQEILVQYGVPAEKVSVVKSSVSQAPYADVNRTNIKAKYYEKFNVISDTVIIGNASAVTQEKGYEVLLQACGQLRAKNVKFFCLIAGDGPASFTRQLKEMTIQLGIEKKVHFLGHISNVYEFLSALDVLVVPSHSEGLGTILLEGALAGCALVGSRVGGIPEIIKHNETGLLVEKGDATALAQALESLISQPELRLRFSQAALHHVKNEFSLEKMIQGNLQIYKNC
jgi:L-malate glycosyltransferase